MKTQEKLAALVAILRGKPDVAKQILADAEAVQKAAEDAGLEYKEVEDMISEATVDETSETDTETTEGVVTEPVTEPASKQTGKEGEEETPDEIGDMSRDQLKMFVLDIIKQVTAPKSQKELDERAQSDQHLADALSALKSFGDRLTAIEALSKQNQQSLLELADSRPVGIKQLQERRQTESVANVETSVPAGPQMDESFVQFLRGGK